MATLLLTAVGTAVGGPIGGAVGAFIGQQADQALFGSNRQGPRLKDLAVTTSSYGQPLPRNFGRMRVAGSIIWSTELQETSKKEGGGKGRPSTTTYSYSASFAVALSSTPIDRIGRIWADGNLLRGSAGDLKVGGELRIYQGTGDNQVDPLIAADKGVQAPGFRDIAYIVFEDLQLGDFGNRIPALTFEIFSLEDETVSIDKLVPDALPGDGDVVLEDARGFSDEGGIIGSTLVAIDQVYPIVCTTSAKGLRLSSAYTLVDPIPVLPEQVSLKDGDVSGERHKQRGEGVGKEPLALRYYDEGRDYQTSVQRAIGQRPDGREIMVDLPAAMNAQGARKLANSNAHRARWSNEHIIWRIGELDPSVGPGSVVRLPDVAGVWMVRAWEWSDLGVELGLDRVSPEIVGDLVGDSGVANPPLDSPITPTQLFALETPPDDNANPSDRSLLAAVTSQGAGWRGAALFVEQGAALTELGTSGNSRAIAGTLAAPIGASNCALIEREAEILVDLVAPDVAIESTDLVGLTNGANRMMIGEELVQFLQAQSLGNGRWRLSGLARGRAGTEPAATLGHLPGTTAVLLDDHATILDSSLVPTGPDVRIAAIGLADEDPVFANMQNQGLSRRALMPIAPSVRVQTDNSWLLCWTRRARGQWTWPDGVEVPIVEEQERYTVGYGSTVSPFASWSLDQPQFTLSQEDRADIIANFGAGQIWVKQVGSYGESPALKLASII